MNILEHILHLTGIYVEIGTDRGNNAEFLLNYSPCSKLYCIDPYMKYEEYKDTINDVTGDQLYDSVVQRLSKFGSRVTLIRSFSQDAMDKVPDDVDFIYVDGNHSYSYVLNDLINWYPKLREGGVLIGDDYIDLDESKRDGNGDVEIRWGNCGGHYGVKKAFTEFIENNNITDYEVMNNQIIIRKK